MLKVNRKQLLRAVQLAGTISQRWNGAKPALQGVLIRVGSEFTMYSTDLDCQLVSKLEFSGSHAMESLPSTTRLLDVIRNEDCEEISLYQDDDKLTIKSETGEYIIQNCSEPDTYPTIVEPEPDKMITVPRAKLLAAIQEIGHAALEGESARYALGGVNFEIGNGKLTLVATDGKQLSHVHIDVEGLEAKDGTMVVPNKAIKTLVQLLKETDCELVNVSFASNVAHFAVNGDRLTARLIEGRYPTWREVIREKATVTIPVNVGALAAMTRRASTMTTDDSRAVTLSFDADSISAEASSTDIGKAKIKLPASYDIKPFKVHLDPAMLLDGLRVLPPDSDVMFSISGKGAALVRLSHGAYPGLESVIVPLTKGDK